ncbi:late transcription factor VLTF-4 [Canarypox virus]|uniref:CNPV188 late transcription factor VLTF-4 n=1 Tax=Canarypox virus TaxID=44088 RepID=Q6VZF9_CNPV|nr:late transcription factor VLTF-4 [Canarypox virus]AAR83534.1 CNPV188 late transcription factor VLTF-4 [Canarypox virus]AWD84664.1 late transcription factor VLTF-4 [Canarypox virus]
MSWPSGDGKPLTIEELKAKAKCENNNTNSNHVADSDSDTEPEVIPEPVKKTVKKTTRKPKKTETPNQEHFVKELDLFNLDESDSNDKCQEPVTEVIDFTETRLVIANICKELKNISSRVSALKTVVQDLSLTDLPKNTSQVIKEVDKLRDLLCNLGISVPVVKQQRKKAK